MLVTINRVFSVSPCLHDVTRVHQDRNQVALQCTLPRRKLEILTLCVQNNAVFDLKVFNKTINTMKKYVIEGEYDSNGMEREPTVD